jgi:N-methylhydantoinase B
VNCPLATVHAAVYYAMIGVLDPHCPPNSGCYRPFSVIAPEGTVVNPRSPGAVAARTNCSQKITEAMLRALANVRPQSVTAGSHGQITTCGISGVDPDSGKRFVMIDIQGGGAGQFRGALGPRRDTRILADEVTLSRYADRQKFSPFGVQGGHDGLPGKLILNPDTDREQPLKSKGVTTLKKGDVLSVRCPGAGGFGDPAKRDPAALAADRRDGKVTS